MNWRELVSEVAARSDLSQASVRRVLDAAVEVMAEQLLDGETVGIKGIGTLTRRWSKGRTLRSVANGRRMWVGGRHTVRFKPSSTLRKRFEDQGDQSWRSPEHQAAWRLAETLIADLELYAPQQVPEDLDEQMDLDQVRSLCAASFGEDWKRAWETWHERVAPEVVHAAHFTRAARRRWAGR